MTLRTKTSLLMTVFIVVIFSVAGFSSLRFLENSLRHSIFNGLDSVSRTSSETISRFLEDTLRDAQSIAFSLPKKALEEKNASAIEDYLKTITEFYPKFENGIFILDKNGNLWADYPVYPETRGKNFAFRQYFKTTIEKQEGIIGVPYRSARTGELVLTFTALLRGSSNQILGLIGCSVKLLHPNVLGHIRKSKIGETGYIYVYDTSRLIILHPEEKRVLQRDVPPGTNKLFDSAIEGFEGVGETVNSKNIPMLISIRRIPGIDWIIGAQQPQSEAFAPIKEARNRIIWGIVFAVLSAILIGAFVVRKLTDPLVKLRQVTLKMGQDTEERGEFREQEKNLQEELKTIHSSDEIGSLAKAFREMNDRLNQTFISLRGSLRNWEQTFDSVEDSIFILGKDNRIQRLNRSAANLLKKGPQEILGQACYRLVHGTEEPPDYCPHDITLKTGRPAKAEIEEPHLKGFFEIMTTPIHDESGKTVGSVHLMRDITERKRAENKLRESEERYRTLAEAAQDMIFIIDRDGLVQYVNEFAAKQLGSSPEKIIGKSQESLFPPEVSERHKMNLRRIFETGRPLYTENSTPFPNQIIYLGTWLAPIQGESGEVKAVLDISRNITDRKQIEEALLESERKYRSLVDNANDAIFIAQDGLIKFPNPSTLRLTGYDEKDYANTPFLDLIHPDDKEMVLDRHRRRLQGEDVPNNYSFRVFNKTGAELWVQLNGVLIEWEGKPAILCFLRDITPQKRLEAQILQAQKMEAVGILAGGIAHDFNNLLQTILGYTEILLMDDGNNSIPNQELNQIKHAAKRGAELTQQLLTFSRKVQSKLRPVNLNQEVRQIEKLLKRTIPKMVEVELDLADDLKTVHADPAQIEQILMNLAVNARDAMPEGGKIIIHTQNVTLDKLFCKDHLGAKPGHYAGLTVSDTGHGMDEETLRHIFDPFFTTKGVGKGTGLGLAMVYGIIKSHGGYIHCVSEKGKGTHFNIYFPVAEQVIIEEKPRKEEKEPRGGRETILLVDDEEPILNFGEKCLKIYGYAVLKALNGEDCLNIYKEKKDIIDLIVLDLLMPGMGGQKCLEEILKMNPKAKVVIASGYSANGFPKNLVEAGAKAFINKPYDVNQIFGVIREVLDGDHLN